MAQKSLADLLQPAVEATESGRLQWRQTESNTYIAQLENYTFRVWEGEDQAGFNFVSADLKRGGEVLDHLSFDEFQSGYERLFAFLKTARRSAVDFDSIADDLLSQLKGKPQ